MRVRSHGARPLPHPVNRLPIKTLCLFVASTCTLAAPSGAGFAGFMVADTWSEGPETSSGRGSAAPDLPATPLGPGESISIDGRLDDAVWARAPMGCGFRTWDPERGKDPAVETVFKVAYDHDALYVAVACHDTPENVAQTLSRRDRFENSDYVSVFIDPYFDRTTGYNFRVNPVGVQQDRYVYNDGDTDTDWNAVWEAETFRDADGWYAEMRIPFSSIRYRSTISTWGLQVRRWSQSRGEDSAWTVWDRDVPGYVSRFGTLSGIQNIPAPRQLELLPYAVARATDPSVAGAGDEVDDFENMGLDLKYGVTSDLTLNATIQPDFGQVEADPAVLNLSPFETFFDEKRPFFVEGNRFFEHRDFNLFYSRRVGTGDENSRIRYASKLTGKITGGVSVAALVAATDETQDGQAHNVFKGGGREATYAIARLGKEFDDGNVDVNATQTMVRNSITFDELGRETIRDAYTSGVDFQAQFADRKYRLIGSVVGSAVGPTDFLEGGVATRETSFGTGGEFSFSRRGNVNIGSWVRWESDRLELNDIGFLGAPDEMNAGSWLSYNYNPEGESSWLNTTELNVNLYKSWLYGDRTGRDLHTDEVIWHYAKGHRSFASGNVNGWMQFKNFAEFWWGLEGIAEGTQRYETRSTVRLDGGGSERIPGGGPLMTEPTTYGAWWGTTTDTRKDLVLGHSGSHYWDVAANYSTSVDVDVNWNQSSALRHRLEIGFSYRSDDTQHLANFENAGAGIGGVSYVFGHIRQKTLDATLRTDVLFSRDHSLELYVQPFLAVGGYTNARELVTPDTYDLAPYDRNGFEASDRDFSFASVNLNAVYRWEYRPGSTLFLVWTHSRFASDSRRDNPSGFDNSLTGSALFDNEPENVFLAKVTWWLPI